MIHIKNPITDVKVRIRQGDEKHYLLYLSLLNDAFKKGIVTKERREKLKEMLFHDDNEITNMAIAIIKNEDYGN